MTATPTLAPAKPDPLGLFRRADWLTAARARTYGWLLLGVSFAVAAAWAVSARGGLDPTGKPLGTDFMSFWSASQLALGAAT